MTLFDPILQRETATSQKSASTEIVFLKAHGILFTSRPIEEYNKCTSQLLGDGMFDGFIGRKNTKFKKIGVAVSLANAASLLEYGIPKARRGSMSILRLALDEERAKREQKKDQMHMEMETESTSPENYCLTPEEYQQSLEAIWHACVITFGTLEVALRRVHDKAILPMVHSYLAMIWHFCRVKKAIMHIENSIPWAALVDYLNVHASAEIITSEITSPTFPKATNNAIGRPLPEDFVLRGQLWTDCYFPENWFADAGIDDEERVLELPSFHFCRLERVLWIAHNISSQRRWIWFDDLSHKFLLTEYARELPPPQLIKQSLQPITASTDTDIVMSNTEDSNDFPDSPLKQPASFNPSKPENEKTKSTKKIGPTGFPIILKRELGHMEMTEIIHVKQEQN